MTPLRRILLVNPKITSRRKARFPLSVLAMAGSLQGQYDSTIIDGNIETDGVAAALRAIGADSYHAVGITVMGGPQVQSAIDVSRAIRARYPLIPIVWGGYFPTLYPAAAVNAPYVDYAVRGQGEETFLSLLKALEDRGNSDFSSIDGLTWRGVEGAVHNRDRRFSSQRPQIMLPYEKLHDPRKYLPKTFMGQRTAAYQSALGCRFRCTFCGVAAMFRGATALPAAQRLEQDIIHLRDRIGADSIQFYDHNFFDREAEMIPLLEVLARHELPWWCYARADALLNLSAEGWALVRKSRLRMAYIGAESPNDEMLRSIRKGTYSDQTIAVAELCRRNGVIPELSFMVAPPEDPVGETERTFDFIRRIKRINPDAEIIIYIHTPLPPESVPAGTRSKLTPLQDHEGNPVIFPTSPEEWTERRWVDYSCHADAPWLTDRLRRRIRDFVTVLNCRYPTLQDTRSPPWAKAALRKVAAWRYRYAKYDRPWELEVSKKLVRLMDPRVTSI